MASFLGTVHPTSPSSKTILSTILPHGDAAFCDGYDAAMNSFHRKPSPIPAARGASFLRRS